MFDSPFSPETEIEEDASIDVFDLYRDLITNLELKKIWLKQAEVSNIHGSEAPLSAVVDVRANAEWNSTSTGFEATSRFLIDFDDDEGERLASISVAFGLDYATPIPMTQDLFLLFGEHNLPLNSWPYLREFLASTTARMGWLTFTLPAMQVGLRPPDSESSAQYEDDAFE